MVPRDDDTSEHFYRRRYREDWSDDADPYASVEWNYFSAQQPRKVEGGIKTKSTRGSIGETWWSRRWLQVLESFGMGARLARGRHYARMGQVISLDIVPGHVTSRVQGSMNKPYEIDIWLQPLSDEAWKQVIEKLSSQAIFAAKLLAGEMPTTIEEVFTSLNLSLFPRAGKDLRAKCSCPDWAYLCKHIAAVYYLLAERFDEDPFLLFHLRGRSKEELLESLRGKRASALPVEDPIEQKEAYLSLEDSLDTFWQAGKGLLAFEVHLQAPLVEKAVLKRLGEVEYVVGEQKLNDLLGNMYDVVQDALVRRLSEEEDKGVDIEEELLS